MKLHIKERESFEIKLWLPTSLLKSKLIIRCIKKHAGKDVQAFITALPILYKELKKYIKKNGHFVLVDVEGSDGYKVFIRV